MWFDPGKCAMTSAQSLGTQVVKLGCKARPACKELPPLW